MNRLLLCWVLYTLVQGCVPIVSIGATKKHIQKQQRIVLSIANDLELYKEKYRNYPDAKTYKDERIVGVKDRFMEYYNKDYWADPPIKTPTSSQFWFRLSRVGKPFYGRYYTTRPLIDTPHAISFGARKTHLSCIIFDLEHGCNTYIYI